MSSLAQRQSERLAAALETAYGQLDGIELLRAMARDVFPGRLAVVSSFGVESAALLALVAEADPGLPVVFLDTGHHFPETLTYRDRLLARLGLNNLVTLRPEGEALEQSDPDATLWQRDPDGCCHLRKVAPLQAALTGFDAWISGRKRYQGGRRGALPAIETADGRIKINPLAHWTKDQVEQVFRDRALPRHPLEAEGCLSIGCRPCTGIATGQDDPRAGRWAGCVKTECGIHWGG